MVPLPVLCRPGASETGASLDKFVQQHPKARGMVVRQEAWLFHVVESVSFPEMRRLGSCAA